MLLDISTISTQWEECREKYVGRTCNHDKKIKEEPHGEWMFFYGETKLDVVLITPYVPTPMVPQEGQELIAKVLSIIFHKVLITEELTMSTKLSVDKNF